MASGIVAQISGTTLWRWLSQDALRPWHHRSWIFPRDPQFARKAGRILDLYLRRWKGAALGPSDYVLCTDEKTSIQARRRMHRSLPPAPHRPIYVEHEYARAGALAYLAAWDVHRAKLFGRCELRSDNQDGRRIASSRNAPERVEHCLTRMLPTPRQFVNPARGFGRLKRLPVLHKAGRATRSKPTFLFDRRACFPVPTWPAQATARSGGDWEERSHPQPRAACS